MSQSSAKYHVSNSQYYILSDGTEREGDIIRTIGSPCPPFDSVSGVLFQRDPCSQRAVQVVTTDVDVGNANLTVTAVTGKGNLYVGFNGVGNITMNLNGR